MPIYVYKYKKPQNEKEAKWRCEKLQMSYEPLKEIDGREVVVVISKTNMKLNGSGFYGTNYK
jgi:predicted nucleic acid-binding Zn ribbon protein